MNVSLFFSAHRKKTLALLVCLIAATMALQAQQPYHNQALHLDGDDNNPCIGMDIIPPQWTLEAWVKGNDTSWKRTEAIIGGGEYSNVNIADPLPLILRNGHLHSNKAGITAAQVLDTNWHHVAATCNGTTTTLYLDGKVVGSANIATAILPGAIGTNDMDSSTFGGQIDEVRIWETALPAATLKAWMGRPLTPAHPAFAKLKGYYNFDDMQQDVCLNLVGKGHQSYHLRNTRKKYKGELPLAYLVKNNNPAFRVPGKKQALFNAVTIRSEWDADQGAMDDQVLKLRIITAGDNAPMKLTALHLDLSQTTSLKDISRIRVYEAGSSPRSPERKLLYSGMATGAALQLSFDDNHAPLLKNGASYFLVTLDVQKEAVPGDTLSVAVKAFVLNGKAYTPEDNTANIRKIVTTSSRSNPLAFKLLQWNIWHGGVHIGNSGKERIKELIRSTDADVVTMQEAYGTQQFLADSLGYHLYTSAPGANLALFSRYPLIKHPSSDKFKSNPATVILPGNRKVLVADWWLRYAYVHEYTDFYVNTGEDTAAWVEEDKKLAMTDAINNLDKDVDPLLTGTSLPVIVAGDFNSGSHLDWTARAAPLHYGYGPVALPASLLMQQRGYADSYRQLYPNELTHPGGTFAAIYGHMQTSRIDFIYYKGTGIKAVASKIIRTPPQIDDVWPSDHSAVLTIFEIR